MQSSLQDFANAVSRPVPHPEGQDNSVFAKAEVLPSDLDIVKVYILKRESNGGIRDYGQYAFECKKAGLGRTRDPLLNPSFIFRSDELPLHESVALFMNA